MLSTLASGQVYRDNCLPLIEFTCLNALAWTGDKEETCRDYFMLSQASGQALHQCYIRYLRLFSSYAFFTRTYTHVKV